jgi:hypothetical protein
MAQHQTAPSDLAKELFVPKILWGAFAVTHIMLSAVFWIVRQPKVDGQPEILPYIFAGIGCLLPIAAPAVRTVFMAKLGSSLSDDEHAIPVQAFFVPMLLAFALAETGAIFGGMVLLLGFDLVYWAVPAALGLLVHLTLFPGQRQLEAWRKELRGRR